MSFINSSGLDDLARRLADSVPESVRAFGRDLEGNFKAVLQAQLSKLDLVSRQEFDVQAALLAAHPGEPGSHGSASEGDRRPSSRRRSSSLGSTQRTTSQSR